MPAPLQQRARTVDNNEIREYNVIEVGTDTQQPLTTKRKLINCNRQKVPREDLPLLGLPPSPTCDSSDEDNH
ncbi:38425_t:CDS:2 [Gigaspora margarita]|uniref:38425_t:CDS:1 n=1 Tax=Gigaspora margarita TaxID=4874 RepID=A0ABM8VXV9_GIGMA|nr:38425_t:CDS:2 [Gigaspora margarita]